MINTAKRILKKILGRPEKPDALRGLPEQERALIERIRSRKLTYLSDAKLVSIANACRVAQEKAVPGLFLEAGCALGGSATLIAFVKDKQKAFNIYDVFGMIPPPTKEDPPEVHERYRIIVEGEATGLGTNKYYGYEKDLLAIVQSNLRSLGINLEERRVKLVQGLVQDTLHLTEPVAFAHIDVDWYDPVMTCLKRVFPRLSIGGVIILDDYHDWGGCRKATDEYLATMTGSFQLDDSAGSMKITKIR
jgi:hypothetical protein